jgi:hypothetical protein
VKGFATQTGVKLNLFARGGHLSTEMIVRKYWERIKKFFQPNIVSSGRCGKETQRRLAKTSLGRA